ncbi:MAG: hypothetical protein AAGB22_04360 [Bacteroidota bacterium]
MKSLLLILMAGLLSLPLTAQPPFDGDFGEKRAQFRQLSLKHVKEQVSLTDEEAAKFWPVYEQFKADQLSIAEQLRKSRPGSNVGSLSEEEIDQRVEQTMALRQQELDLERDYYKKARTMLSAQKVAEVFRAERSFRRKMVERLRNRRMGSQGRF